MKNNYGVPKMFGGKNVFTFSLNLFNTWLNRRQWGFHIGFFMQSVAIYCFGWHV